jgi:hypothetical protein
MQQHITITGLVHEVGETIARGKDGTFFTREIVLIDDPEATYPDYRPLKAIKEACETLDGIAPGDEVEAVVRHKGRRWESAAGEVRYFCDLEILEISNLSERAARRVDAEPSEMPGFDRPTDEPPF